MWSFVVVSRCIYIWFKWNDECDCGARIFELIASLLFIIWEKFPHIVQDVVSR